MEDPPRRKKENEIKKRLGEAAEARRKAQSSVRKDKRGQSVKRLRTENGMGGAGTVGTGAEGDCGPQATGTPAPSLALSSVVGSPSSLKSCFDALVQIGSPVGNDALGFLRRVMCTSDAPIQEIVDANVVPLLVLALRSTDASVRSDALWCLTNIATGDHDQTAQVLQAVPVLLELLACGDSSLQEQACWALGNIAGDSDEFRVFLITNGAIPPLLAFLASSAAATGGSPTDPGESRITSTQTAAWAISNLSRGSIAALEFVASGSIPLLVSLTSHSDPVVVTEMWWLFYYLSGKENEAVECMFHSGMADAMAQAISRANPEEITTVPILRTLCNLTNGPVEWRNEILLRPQLLPALALILSSTVSHKEILKEALFATGNIFDGPVEHRALALEAGLLNQAFQSLLAGGCDLQREAVLSICKACVDVNAVMVILHHGGKTVIGQLVALLRAMDTEIILASLHILRVLALGFPLGCKSQVIHIYNEFELYDLVEGLQYNSNPTEVRQAAVAFLDDVFEEDEDVDDDDSHAQIGGLSFDVGAGGGGLGGMGRGRHLVRPAWMT